MDSSLALITLLFLVMCSSAIDEAASLQCVQKLIACQPYLKNPDNPPALCCIPLKDMIANDPKCLCDVFNNPDLLKTMNVTQDEALQLPKACGANVDVSSVCDKDASVPTTPPPTSHSPSVPSTNSTTPADNNATNSASNKYGEIVSGGTVGLMGFLMALFVI